MTLLARMRNAFTFRRRLKSFAAKVATLEILDAGVDTDGDAYVHTPDGMFFGHPIRATHKSAHRMLPRSARRRLPLEAFQVALDVVIRYHEGALSYGGPAKQRDHVVSTGEHVAEMGAYLGHYSMRLAQQVGPNGRVLAIEANPHNHRILEKNLRENHLDQVTLIKKGVWNNLDSLDFSIRAGDHQSTSAMLEREEEEVVRVPVEPLDRILKDAKINTIDFMIIQLNGAEPEALEGLTRVRPLHFAIASRYSPKGVPTTPRILQILQKRGYRAEVVADAYVFADLLEVTNG